MAKTTRRRRVIRAAPLVALAAIIAAFTTYDPDNWLSILVFGVGSYALGVGLNYAVDWYEARKGSR